MICDRILSDGVLTLRTIELSNVNDSYLQWLQNPNVNRFLETRWEEQTLEKIFDFVRSIRESDHSCLFAMVDESNQKHIGNIKIGPVNPHYRFADISYFIGDTDYWSKGYATRAVRLICEYGFQDLQLRRIEAGAFDTNISSIKALTKNGFVEEGRIRKQRFAGNDNDWHDCLRFGLLKE